MKQPQRLADIIENAALRGKNVNDNKERLKDVNVDSGETPAEKEYKDLSARNKDLANTLTRELKDKKSQRYFEIVAENNDHGLVIESLQITLSALNDISREKSVSNASSYFIGVLRTKGGKTKFKK
ncbi:MAG: hypothetical protein HN846_00040 [Candidatus Pacebacteria bacterium]|jgi:hypothetical protein|nr:hypothetical protein [Candidatus Paceibacterota bacterium]MBT3512167.1 hypothetical protein [Candidatus Paceibacterota bacterium]MBT4004894.1 hypothetical protein [Candidatus Paceibacterota bacterium]MBT4358664.1 hypothetical protein [Candidatus Paceibacterota bacterium]MBT4681341.1 hypothetical protein [Candidatus Paceibacterota bacterium]